MSFLKVDNIGREMHDKNILSHISFTQEKFKKIAIAGATGSGKSTLLKIIAGLIKPTTGQVFLNRDRVLGPDEKLLPGHPHIAYLSQDFELRNNYIVADYLNMAAKISVADAAVVYQTCRIQHLLQRKTNAVSGGERQRIALARLLVTAPQLLLLDEPYSNLDATHKSTLKYVIDEVSRQRGVTCILVSHDVADTLSWADEIIILKNGLIVQSDVPSSIYYHPADEYVAGLFGAYNLFSAKEALAFFNVELPAGVNNIMVRPEKLLIKDARQNVTSATIVSQLLMGNYVLLSADLNEKKILVATTSSQWQIGQTVSVALQPADFWPLP